MVIPPVLAAKANYRSVFKHVLNCDGRIGRPFVNVSDNSKAQAHDEIKDHYDLAIAPIVMNEAACKQADGAAERAEQHAARHPIEITATQASPEHSNIYDKPDEPRNECWNSALERELQRRRM